MNKCTLQPWNFEELNYKGLNITEYFVRSADGLIVAKCGATDEARHDAHLIAAAPELYEALEFVYGFYEGWVGKTAIVENALKKARGEA